MIRLSNKLNRRRRVAYPESACEAYDLAKVLVPGEVTRTRGSMEEIPFLTPQERGGGWSWNTSKNRTCGKDMDKVSRYGDKNEGEEKESGVEDVVHFVYR